MAEINHKWERITRVDGPAQRCVRCRIERRAHGKTSHMWLVAGVWKVIRLQPECTALPKSERERSP